VKVALVKQCVGVFCIVKEVMEGSREQCQIQQGKWSQGESKGLMGSIRKYHFRIGLFRLRIKINRLEPMGKNNLLSNQD
jgi:hypothetical protein